MKNIIKLAIYSGLTIMANVIAAKCGSEAANIVKEFLKNEK